MALMRYHDVPETAVPGQLVCQRPPLTVAAMETLAPFGMTVTTRAASDAWVRTLDAQAAVLDTVAPRTSAGAATDSTVTRRVADRKAVTTLAGRDERVRRGETIDTM